MKNTIYFFCIFLGVLCSTCFSSDAQTKNFFNYSIPVSDVVANALITASKDLEIELYEFFYLSSCAVHSKVTTKLIKDNDRVWRLDFVSSPDNSYLVFLWLNRAEGFRMNQNQIKPLNSRELAEILKKEIKNNKSYDVDLKKLRRVELLQKEISEKVWSASGDGEE